MIELTAEDVIDRYPFRRAVKSASTKIRPFIEQDVFDIGESFFDLEGREHRVEVGRYFCVGVRGERWSCSEKSMQGRVAVSELDDQGFRLYVQRNPQPVLATLIHTPFRLNYSDGWTCEGGFITWNGLLGDQMIMRVIEYDIFNMTYEFLPD